MTLQELIAALTGGERRSDAPYIRERDTRPMSQAPARYPGQPGALRRDPIPEWANDLQGPAQERMSVMRGQEGGLRRPVGPGGVTGDEPPLRVPFRALQGPRPSMGTAADWIQGPPPPLPRAPYIGQSAPDTEPWRQPEGALSAPVDMDTGLIVDSLTGEPVDSTGREAELNNRRYIPIPEQGAAPQRGMEPPSAPPQEPWPWGGNEQEDPAFTAALRRVQELRRQQQERAIMAMSPVERASGLRPRRY